jgi:stalled ribosome alternative rescue factor ArfA
VYALLFDTPTLHEKRVAQKRKREETSYKRNFSEVWVSNYSAATKAVPLEEMMATMYCKKF